MAASEGIIRIRISGVEYELDPETLSWGEMEEIEKYFGQSFEEIDLASARGAMLLAYIAKRRTDATVTLDDIRRLPMAAVEVVEDEVPPTEAEVGEGSESGLPSSQSMESVPGNTDS